MHVKKSQNPIKYVILTVLLAAYIFPFFMVLINAFKEKVDVIKNPLSLLGERGFILSNFPAAMEKMNFFRASGNSLLITGVSVVLIVLFSAMAAYIMARENWLVCRVFFSLLILSLAIPFQVLMIPLVSIYGGMFGILNHRLTLIFMHVGFGVGMSSFLFYGAFSSDLGLLLAALVLMIIPVLLLYLLLQKYIIEGVVAGAVKG